MKQVYLCEGCGACYNSEDQAEKCEEFHNTEINDIEILKIKFKKHSCEIEAVLIRYDRLLVGIRHKEEVWFHPK